MKVKRNRRIEKNKDSNKTYNSVIRKLFNYKNWESVKGILHGLGRLNISHLIILRKVKFYKHFLSADSCLLYTSDAADE